MKGKPAFASVPHERTPFVDFTSQEAAPRPETVRLVVEAVPVLSIWKSVDVANALVEEEIAKSVGPVKVVEAAKSENLA